MPFLRAWSWRQLGIFSYDVLMVPVALWFAYLTRFDGTLPISYQTSFWLLISFAIPIHAFVFWIFSVQRGLWRFTSLHDLWLILRATSTAMVLLIVIIFASKHIYGLYGIPRTALLLFWIYLTGLLIFSRLSVRIFKEHRWVPAEHSKTVVIWGAGTAGRNLLRQLRQRPELGLGVKFLLDNAMNLHGRTVDGIAIKAGLAPLKTALDQQEVDEVLLAEPDLDSAHIRQILALCERYQVPCRTLPSLLELDERVELSQLRPVSVEDLLGREPVRLDSAAISGYLRQQTVLITGGGGSIGAELCRQVLAQQPAQLIVFDNCEYNLYQIEQELQERHPESSLLFLLGDAKDANKVNWLFEQFQPQVIFHAAAYKHVPLIELNPDEGIRNNVLATKIVADAADAYRCERFVLVSTDKAVNPANIMGATKQLAELYCQALGAKSQTAFITTRFGNVLGSAGSVVPLFKQQIERGGPVTVTHSEITRYFMTIPEAAALILQAGAMGQGGEIFVLDMGERIRILDLAKQMIRLSGLEPEIDIPIKYIGLRPGEKLYEELFYDHEGLLPTKHPKLLLATTSPPDWDWLNTELEQLFAQSMVPDQATIVSQLQRLLPGFQFNP